MRRSKIDLIGPPSRGFPPQSRPPRPLPMRRCSHPATNPDANSRPKPLEASRCPCSEHPAHNDPQVVTRHPHQVTRADLQQATQPTPTAAPSLAHMREAPFHFLAAELLQPLAAASTHPATIVAVGTLPPRGLVRPDTIVLTL